MGSGGYQTWASPVHKTLIINGEVYRVGFARPHRWSRDSQVNVLETHARTHILQTRVRGGQEPIGMTEINDRVEFQIDTREEYERLDYALSISEGGVPVKFFVDAPVTDVWALGNRASGQTTFQSSRRTPWGLTGIDKTTRPPVAQTVSSSGATTDLTVVDSAGPSAGEIYIPAATGSYFATFETQAGLTGEYLRVTYNPEMLVVIDQVDSNLDGPNDWNIELRVNEVFLQARTGL